MRSAIRRTRAMQAWRACSTSQRPNTRLKLTDGDRFKGSGVLCAGARELSFNYIAPCGRVARSLSAIR